MNSVANPEPCHPPLNELPAQWIGREANHEPCHIPLNELQVQ
jgi:hypothetical protein